MDLKDEFRVGVPIDHAWEVLTDIERIAPCMPGAQLEEVEGDEYRGIVKVKVGPITAQYKGKATILERDDAAHRLVLNADGRETRGNGNASARITATLEPDGDGTKATIDTHLQVSGKVAQFGRGVLADVSGKLLGQFVDCLHSSVLSEQASAAPTAASAAPAAPAAAAASAAAPTGARKIESAPAEPVDLVDAAGGSVAKRVGPVVAALAALWLLRLFLKRRRRG
jgi:carbon monoxide dehydrogenase subunit G